MVAYLVLLALGLAGSRLVDYPVLGLMNLGGGKCFVYKFVAFEACLFALAIKRAGGVKLIDPGAPSMLAGCRRIGNAAIRARYNELAGRKRD